MEALKRRFNDTLIISGELEEETPIDDAAWDGATATIKIVRDIAAQTVMVSAGEVALDTTVTPKRVEYHGDPIEPDDADEDLRKCLFEWTVTFLNGTVLTWPGDNEKLRLWLYRRLGS